MRMLVRMMLGGCLGMGVDAGCWMLDACVRGGWDVLDSGDWVRAYVLLRLATNGETNEWGNQRMGLMFCWGSGGEGTTNLH